MREPAVNRNLHTHEGKIQKKSVYNTIIPKISPELCAPDDCTQRTVIFTMTQEDI